MTDVIKSETSTNEAKTDLSQELEQQYFKLDFSQLARAIVQDIDGGGNGSIMFSSFPKDRVITALQNPQKNEKTLRDLSNFLYILSPHYRRLCNYHAEAPLLNHMISPHKLDIDKVNVKQFKKAYNDNLNLIENMNIKHEFAKILQIAYREGIFYGYEYETDESYFIQKLNPDNCRISSTEDGVYNYQFNFQYFEMDETKLENYAPEFTTKYNLFKNSKKNRKKGEDLQWQELESENTICIKTDETIVYPFPPFSGVFSDIYEIEDYKALKKANSEMQNIAILTGTIPMNDKSDVANDFKVTLDTAINFGNQITTQLPDQVGFILSVYDDMKMFKLSDDKVGTDKVSEAVGNFWNSTGVSKNLFTDGGTTNATVRASVITDEQSVFIMLRQLERWVNRKLKLTGGKYKFKFELLNVTNQNQAEKVAEELKMAQFGIPNKIRLITSSGVGQQSIEGINYLELDVLGLGELVPLQSSHTSSNANAVTGGEKGRPSENEDSLRTDGD